MAVILILVSAGLLFAQTQTPTAPDPSKDPIYFCPMDRDVRSNGPGNCSRCGMKLVAGVPDPFEYHLDLTVNGMYRVLGDFYPQGATPL